MVGGIVSESNGGTFDDIRKVAIPQSPETTALEKKQLVDWAVTTFNAKPGSDPVSYIHAVWIQPSGDVDPKDVDDKSGIETHWVKFL